MQPNEHADSQDAQVHSLSSELVDIELQQSELLETLDFVSASYDLQIQQHRELLRRRRQRRARSEYSQSAAAPDFLIRPRRAA